MSDSSWSRQLDRSLTEPARRSDPPGRHNRQRTVILGVGSEFNGDDAAGIQVIRRLKQHLSDRADLLLLEGGPAPENFTAPIRRFNPGLVVFVDSAAMAAGPGTVAWLEMDTLDGLSATTHTLPLSVLGKFLQAELKCEIALIGIQPESLEFNAPLSGSVERAVDEVVAGIVRLLSDKKPR